MYFSDVEKTGETDLVEKPKSIYLGKWLYPKSEQVAMRLISGGRVTYELVCTDTVEDKQISAGKCVCFTNGAILRNFLLFFAVFNIKALQGDRTSLFNLMRLCGVSKATICFAHECFIILGCICFLLLSISMSFVQPPKGGQGV